MLEEFLVRMERLKWVKDQQLCLVRQGSSSDIQEERISKYSATMVQNKEVRTQNAKNKALGFSSLKSQVNHQVKTGLRNWILRQRFTMSSNFSLELGLVVMKQLIPLEGTQLCFYYKQGEISTFWRSWSYDKLATYLLIFAFICSVSFSPFCYFTGIVPSKKVAAYYLCFRICFSPEQ